MNLFPIKISNHKGSYAVIFQSSDYALQMYAEPDLQMLG